MQAHENSTFRDLENLNQVVDLSHPHLSSQPQDGRLPLRKLYDSHAKLAATTGWKGEIVTGVPVLDRIDGNEAEAVKLPVVSIRTDIKGRAIWVIAGVHGEEPAGPNALAKNIHLLEELEKAGVPVVVFPMMNPAGYFRDWRYFNYQNWHPNCPGISATDCDHLLPSLQDPTKPMAAKPMSKAGNEITAAALRLITDYPPRLVIDLHEDRIHDHTDQLLLPYIYSHGKFGARDGIARRVVSLFKKIGMPLEESGITRSGEPIQNGIVVTARDGSIDDMLASRQIFVDGKIINKKPASSVIVVETAVDGLPLAIRERAHQYVLENLVNFWTYIQSKRKAVGKSPDNTVAT